MHRSGGRIGLNAPGADIYRAERVPMTRLSLLWFLIAAPMAAAAPPSGHAVATFAGGCFWCMQPPFDKTPGVVGTRAGYTGGQKANPTYEEVSSGGTGHAESVEVVYDPKLVTYQQLLGVYW